MQKFPNSINDYFTNDAVILSINKINYLVKNKQ